MTREAVVEALRSFPLRLAAGASAVAGPPPPGEWSAVEVVGHLIAVERIVWQARLQQVASEVAPHWPWTEPRFDDGPVGRPLEILLATFDQERAATLAIVDGLDEDGWARIGIHATYGRLDVAGLLELAVDHDAEHLAAVEGSGATNRIQAGQ